MRFIRNRILLVLFALLCATVIPVRSNAAPERAMTDEQWRKLTNDKAFDYKIEKQAKPKPKTTNEHIEDYKPGPIARFFSAVSALFSGTSGAVIAWLFVIGLVAFIVYRIVVSNGGVLFGKRSRKMADDAAVENLEDIGGTNWERLVDQALSGGDYRLAIRYSYMWLLQLLEQRELIRYRIDKTNSEYSMELEGTNYRSKFRLLSRQYEYAWYGNYNLTPAGYEEFRTLFRNLKNDLSA